MMEFDEFYLCTISFPHSDKFARCPLTQFDGTSQLVFITLTIQFLLSDGFGSGQGYMRLSFFP